MFMGLHVSFCRTKLEKQNKNKNKPTNQTTNKQANEQDTLGSFPWNQVLKGMMEIGGQEK